MLPVVAAPAAAPRDAVARDRQPSKGWTGVDALRFVAAFFIVLYHFGSNAPTPLDAVSPMFARGYLATDFFLILSGYVLGRAYGPQLASAALHPAEFLRRRLLRIWPAHLIVIAGFVALMLVAGLAGGGANRPEAYRWIDLPAQLMLVQAWGLPVGGGGWNLPTWSLSALVVCYAAFPLLWGRLGRVNSPAVLLGLMLCALAGAEVLVRLWLHEEVFSLGFHYGACRAAPLFFTGACLARLSQVAPLGARPSLGLAVAGAVALAVLQVWPGASLASMFALAALVWGAGGLKGSRQRLIADAGRMSFSLFLTHAFAGALWFGGLHAAVHQTLPPVIGWAVWAGGIVFALALATAFDRLVDAPAQAWLRRLRLQARPGAPARPSRTTIA